MTDATTHTRTATTDAPLLDVLAERWSPRSFDADATIDAHALDAALEAARWAPSASNSQPWRFIVGRRGTRTFEQVHAALADGNRVWADKAAALVVNVAETADLDGTPRPWGHYDLGQSVAYLAAQAHHDGLHTHQMGGFDRDTVRRAFGLDERFEPVSIIAIGVLASPDALPERLREREVAPRRRMPLDEIVLHRD
ncbi:nitroreductase family protein [Agromyces mangrovi Wang et al. 2018]|uniref:nitroreductase family protein n=1 Tax=Agromyces mangrovi TaxID=1858653 RepID=UPI0025728A86|nr:nitroreductase family protein [Agromyces mangrovi]BDZ64470.1 nitroreductase [Agromyces mangrovi]